MPRRRLGRAELEFRFAGATWRFRKRGQPRGLRRRSRRLHAALRRPRSDRGGARRGDARPSEAVADRAEQRLYLFYSAEARAAFAAQSRTRAIEAAERHWPEVLRTLAP